MGARPARARRRGRLRLRRVGAERTRRVGRRRLQRVGRPRASASEPRRERPVGDVRARRPARHGLQVRDPSAAGPAVHEGRSVRARRRAAAAHRLGHVRPRPPRVARCRLDDRTPRPQHRSISRCRSTRCTPDRGAAIRSRVYRSLTWRELATELVPYVQHLGLHAHRAAAGHGASVRWLVGLSGHRATSRRPAATASPDDFRSFVDECHRHGIGVILDWVPGHFPKDAHGLAWFDGTSLFEHARSAAGRAPRLGHAHLQLRPARGPQLPADQRALLARVVPRRRAARRRRRVDDLPRLLAPGRRVGAERVRRPRESRSDRFPARAQHGHARAPPGHGDHRRGVHGVSGRQPADLGRAAWASPSSGTWAGCTTS